MSMTLTALMLQHGPSDPLAKLIALCLTDRANEVDLCWPSRADIQARTGASNATITRKLRMLEVAGYIARKQRHNGTTVFRINAPKLRALELQWQAKRAVVVPEGFEPFPEELAAAPLPKALQAIVNKGDAHSEHGDAHSEHGDAHSEQLTSHKPIKNRRAGAASAKPVHRQPRRLPPVGGGAADAAEKAVEPVKVRDVGAVDAAAFVQLSTEQQKNSVRRGWPVQFQGVWIEAASPLMAALADAVRKQAADEGVR